MQKISHNNCGKKWKKYDSRQARKETRSKNN